MPRSLRLLVATGLIGAFAASEAAFPCSRVGDVDPAQNAREAEAIVVARAVEYLSTPNADEQDGAARGSIVFDVVKSLKGRGVPTRIVLPGTLKDEDDYNPDTFPYRFVRPQGRGGWCFARTYRQGALFLLMLKTRDGEYTVEWDALAPNNEQLHGLDDPWIEWVREQAAKPPEK
jgi:hypothetical protein